MMSRRGFSLVELLVVLGVLAVLFGLFLPAVQRVRESANRLRCIANLKQISLALHNYHDRNGALPPATTNDPADLFRYVGWAARILPDVDDENRWNETLSALRQNRDVMSVPPHFNLERGIALYQCPADGRGLTSTSNGRRFGLSAYLGNAGRSRATNDGVLYCRSSVRLTDITDGTSTTILVGERPSPERILGNWYGGPGLEGTGSTVSNLGVRELQDGDAPFLCPSPAHFGPSVPNSKCGYLHFWSFHPGGANFAFCDGSVRFIRYEADRIMPAMGTRSGGEVVDATLD